MSFLKVVIPLPTGHTQVVELDEKAAREALVEMETWGDHCSQDCKDMRAALRLEFNKLDIPAARK